MLHISEMTEKGEPIRPINACGEGLNGEDQFAFCRYMPFAAQSGLIACSGTNGVCGGDGGGGGGSLSFNTEGLDTKAMTLAAIVR